MAEHVIRLSDVSVSLDGRPILSGIDLGVESSSWTCLIGPNGSGKTTLLRAVAGLVPYSGEVLVCGDNVVRVNRRRLARTLAYVPQNPVIPEGMAVKDYVLIGRTPYISYLGTESRQDIEIAATVLQRVRLEGFGERILGSLSGGELQRVIIARALAQEPRILLLDEPTSGLDVGHQQQVLELVDDLRTRQGLTVLSAIHDLTLAAQFSERVVVLDGGRLCASGSPREVLTEELLLELYGAHVRVVDGPAGGLAVVPRRKSGAEASPGARRTAARGDA